MDRSYPYSRRLVSRSRLRKRMAAVVGAGVAAAVALFALEWDAGPISTGVQPQAQPVLALAAAGDTGASGVRRIYPYSVVPGGVSGQVELARVVRTDRVVAAHYASFDVDKARPVVVGKPRAVHVSYRKGDKVYWTAGKVMLAPGETLLSDGRSEMRARCANRISDVPQYPIEDHRPAMEELDHPVEVDGGDGGQYALGPEGLPVSMDPDGAIPRHTGQRFPARGGGYASNAAPANAALSGSTHGSGGFDGGVLSAMGLSGSSSSMGGRPRPAGTPAATPPASTPGTGTGAAPVAGTDIIGGSAGSAGSTEPGGIATVPQPATGAPAVTPQPGTDSSAPSTGSPSTGSQPQTGTTIPTDPLPLPGAEPPAVLLPVLDVTPDEEPASGGIPAAPVPPPLDGPLFPQPGTNTEPFIPKPDLGPAPLPPGGAEQTTPPAGVPEPGSIWLGGLALAAMLGLRRRRA